MTISAKIIADSLAPTGHRLSTLQLRYPRFIHAEFMTHRVFSRNASSSRAIPVEKMIEDLRRDPAMPIYWGANQKGMQAAQELSEEAIEICEQHWLNAMELMIDKAQDLLQLGLHKQIANRILEPWAHINVVVSATDWENFFALRCHPDAQPEMKELADAIWMARYNSVPTPLQPGEWHLPYVTKEDWNGDGWDSDGKCPNLLYLKKLSVARCASVSYKTVDGLDMTADRAIALYDRLLSAQPLHASPAEHQATPDKARWDNRPAPLQRSQEFVGWENEHLHGNFTGFIQYRKTLGGECIPG